MHPCVFSMGNVASGSSGQSVCSVGGWHGLEEEMANGLLGVEHVHGWWSVQDCYTNNECANHKRLTTVCT